MNALVSTFTICLGNLSSELKNTKICDAIKQNEFELQKQQLLSFHLQCMPQFRSYIMLKTPSKYNIYGSKDIAILVIV